MAFRLIMRVVANVLESLFLSLLWMVALSNLNTPPDQVHQVNLVPPTLFDGAKLPVGGPMNHAYPQTWQPRLQSGRAQSTTTATKIGNCLCCGILFMLRFSLLRYLARDVSLHSNIMDQLFHDLIGKPTLHSPKILTLIAENFSFLEDEARFLKATLAIPMVKNLPFSPSSIKLVQIGPIHSDIKNLLEQLKYSLTVYEDLEKLELSLRATEERCLVFINDVSRLILGSSNSDQSKKLIGMAEKLKRAKGHFVVVLYQNSEHNPLSPFLRDLEYMSDASMRVSSSKVGYFFRAWYRTVPTLKTLLPTRVETSYFTCKIGKYYYSPEFLCFYERKNVSKNWNPDSELEPEINADLSDEELDASSETQSDSTLPYTIAQNPEYSRIFYYPDKDDDIDEDDPDSDLGI